MLDHLIGMGKLPVEMLHDASSGAISESNRPGRVSARADAGARLTTSISGSHDDHSPELVRWCRWIASKLALRVIYGRTWGPAG